MRPGGSFFCELGHLNAREPINSGSFIYMKNFKPSSFAVKVGASVAALALATATPAVAEPAGSSATGSSAIGSSTGATIQPAEYNDDSCTPAPEHATPVLLVHGTQDSAKSFAPLAERLQENGYCAFGFTYGQDSSTLPGILPNAGGVGDMDANAGQLAEMVERVQSITGSDKVDIVAHSQGATITKMYMQELGGADNIRRFVAMGGTFHGTTLGGMDALLRPFIDAFPLLSRFFAGTGATQQVVGSPIIERLNTYPDTTPGVVFTSLFSPADTTATPNSTSHLEAVPGADVANVDIQAACQPTFPVLHPQMPGHAVTSGLALWGLEREEGQHTPTAADCGAEFAGPGSS